MAKEAERKAQIAKEQGPKKVAAINLSQKWINWVIVALIAFQVFLNIAAYNAALAGMKNISLFFVGLILVTFAGFFHVYRYGLNEAKKAPPPPPTPIPDERPKALEEAPAAPESGKLPEDDSGDDKKEAPKEIPETPTPQVKADVQVDLNKDQNLGTSDLTKP